MKLQLPGMGYRQGGRQMVITAMSPVALVKTVEEPDHWNPVGNQPHGNRPQDKGHRKAIAEYLETEENFVLNAVVLYAKPSEAKFVPLANPDAPTDDDDRQLGTLYLEYGAKFDVGDGQHRIGAYSDVIKAHEDEDGIVMERLRESGQPVVVVIDDNPLHRAQDFTDLQRNAKPPSASIGLSMDRRQPINRLLIELVGDEALQIFDDRVEFLKDSPGKLSAKLFSYKTVRYASGTVLIGTSQRSTAGWEKAVNAFVEHSHDEAKAILVDFWDGLGQLGPFADVLDGQMTAAQLRERTYLTSGGVLYAIAYAAHTAREADKVPVSDVIHAVGKVSFDRPDRSANLTPDDTIFAGNLVDPMNGKIAAGRAAWEAAGEALLARIRQAIA